MIEKDQKALRHQFPQWSAGVDLINDVITFAEPHGLETGEGVGYYLYNSGSAITPLADGQVYWVRAISQNQITLHPTSNDAVNNTAKINLTAYGQGGGVFAKRPFLQSAAINTTTDVITLPFQHNFKIGESVIYNALSAASPLVKESLYWVRPVSDTALTIHPTRADAIKNTNKINFTTSGTGYAVLTKFFSLLYKTAITNL